MLTIHKKIVYDKDHKPMAIQIPIKEFEELEEILENYGLSKMMDEVQDEKRLSIENAKKYYKSIKQNVES